MKDFDPERCPHDADCNIDGHCVCDSGAEWEAEKKRIRGQCPHEDCRPITLLCLECGETVGAG